jgi:hypothetical protein
MSCATSFSLRCLPWILRHPFPPQPSTVLLLVVMHLRRAKPLTLCRPGLLPSLPPLSLQPLIRPPPPMEVVPGRATVGVAAPPEVVLPAGVAARHGHNSQALDRDHRYVVGPSLECLPSSYTGPPDSTSLGVPPTTPALPQLPPPGIPTQHLEPCWLEDGIQPPSPPLSTPW